MNDFGFLVHVFVRRRLNKNIYFWVFGATNWISKENGDRIDSQQIQILFSICFKKENANKLSVDTSAD